MLHFLLVMKFTNIFTFTLIICTSALDLNIWAVCHTTHHFMQAWDHGVMCSCVPTIQGSGLYCVVSHAC